MYQVLLSILLLACSWGIFANGTRPSECELTHEIGRCRAMIPAYYFNPSLDKCELFMYGGCEGNENRFHSEAECLQRCGSDSSRRNG